MGEFVDGFETLRGVWPAVSIFGGSRVRKSNPYYKDSVKIAKLISDAGFKNISPDETAKSYAKFENAIKEMRKHLLAIKDQNNFLMKTRNVA